MRLQNDSNERLSSSHCVVRTQHPVDAVALKRPPPRVARTVIVGFVVVSLAGCAGGSYPTRTQVTDAAQAIPPLETIAEGRGYLQVVRNNLSDERDALQKIDYGLDAGILGGVITVALGTALHWGASSTIKAGILAGALVGVGSALSLKTQEQVINKGLDSLNCVESQAEIAYSAVKPFDVVLAPIYQDVSDLQEQINVLASQNTDGTLSPVINAAQADVSSAKAWVAIESIPVSTVNAGVKIGVNSVLQTTIDQLNNNLPDSSAFAKISTSLPTQITPVASAPTPSPKLTSNEISFVQGRSFQSLQVTGLTIAQNLSTISSRLNNDLVAAKAALEPLGPVMLTSLPPTINCGVAVVTSLQLSSVSGPIVANPKSTATVTITGGTPAYKTEITAAKSGLTPEGIVASPPNGSAIVLTGSATLQPGAYGLIVTDATGSTKATVITVAANALPPKLTTQTPAKTWKPGDIVSFTLPPNTFTDPQGEPLTYSVSLADGTPLPAWLHFDPATRVFSGTAGALTGTWTLKVTVSNAETPPLTTSESFVVTVAK